MRIYCPVLLLSLILASCSPNNVEIDNGLKKYFDDNQVNGCFAIMDNGTAKFTIYNLYRYRDSSFLPAATLNIVNTLVGLQTGKISNDSMRVGRDSVPGQASGSGQDLTMYRAFRVSAVPYFQEIARRIGKDTMQYWLDSIKYGTRKITSHVDTFWLDNSLKITPDEQLGLVQKLYFNELPFFRAYQEIVRRAMLMEKEDKYRLGYLTGSGTTEKGHALGWILGWVEENNHAYFYVLNIESPNRDYDMSATPVKMLKDILRKEGFLEGKM
jgi:beta-lactamase class D